MDGILIKYFKPVIEKLAYSSELNSYLLNLLVNASKLENFSNNEPPLNPVEGQIWFDTSY
jgi:hypothetical protein